MDDMTDELQQVIDSIKRAENDPSVQASDKVAFRGMIEALEEFSEESPALRKAMAEEFKRLVRERLAQSRVN